MKCESKYGPDGGHYVPNGEEYWEPSKYHANGFHPECRGCRKKRRALANRWQRGTVKKCFRCKVFKEFSEFPVGGNECNACIEEVRF